VDAAQAAKVHPRVAKRKPAPLLGAVQEAGERVEGEARVPRVEGEDRRQLQRQRPDALRAMSLQELGGQPEGGRGDHVRRLVLPRVLEPLAPVFESILLLSAGCIFQLDDGPVGFKKAVPNDLPASLIEIIPVSFWSAIRAQEAGFYRALVGFQGKHDGMRHLMVRAPHVEADVQTVTDEDLTMVRVDANSRMMLTHRFAPRMIPQRGATRGQEGS
jgi:hypothetical protein